MEYEINFLVLQSHTEAVDQIRDKVKDLIKEYKGSTTNELVYKKRRLAYEIKHEVYGFFTVLRFKLENNSDILELKRELNLVQDIARYIIVQANELPELSSEILSMESREKSTVKQEDVEKMIAKSENTKEVKQEEVKKIETVEKKEEKKVGEKKEDKKEESKGEKDADDKSSLEDLDKKLDEILSI